MKKLYSIVLMAAALLISTNVKAVNVSDWAGLKAAMQAGGEVVLTSDINASDLAATDCIWIGSVTEDGDAPATILNLNGHNITIKPAVNAINPFVLTKGSLKVTSSSPATISVAKGNKVIYSGTNVFTVFGASTASASIDPKTSPFSHLEIDENVTVQTQNGTVIAIDQLVADQGAVKNLPTPKPTYTTTHYAFGACIDVKGKLFSQGAEATPASDAQKCYGVKINGNVDLVPEDADKPYAPYVHVHPSAVITTDYTFAKAAACYASGYGQWLIEGTCSGAIGVYAGKGDIVIKDATVKSGAETYTAPTSAGGANGSGSGVVINSRGGTYDGEVHVTITGDSKVESKDGYAVEERVNTTDGETNVSSLTISGGTFVGDQEKGAIIVTEKTAETTTTTISIAGGNITGTTGVIGADSLATYLNKQSDTHATLVTDAQGNTTLVISGGEAPSGMADFVSNADLSVKWTGASKDITGTFALKELEINESTAQVLTVKQNATFTVERVILGANAQIIVEAGGKFIVTGNQGIVAPVNNNIILQNEGALTAAERKHATFLFNPNVKSNRHPNATVELTTYSYSNGASDYQWERFGVPSYTALDSIKSASGVATAFSVATLNGWQSLGYINYPGKPEIDPADFDKPFATYELIANRSYNPLNPTIGPKYQFFGALVGNDDAVLDVNKHWTGFTNSYSANVDVLAMFAAVKAASIVNNYVYIAKPGGLGSYTWEAIEEEDAAGEKLAPMQAFILAKPYGSTETEEITLNYNSMVYAPAPATAPRRLAASNDYTALVRVIVENENGVWDNVKLRETATRTREIEKYMNNDVNIYATTEGKAAILATEDLENTYVGFSTVKGGNFTINFAGVEGSEYMLIDHETGAEVLMVEGNTYEFTADANSANDYRFEIVSPRKVTTAIENAEAVKSAKGIYTITGQYMGEMNVWNSLPAGVYVVNGEKRVK